MSALIALHARVFGALERAAGGWAPGLLARFAFAAVLAGYFWAAGLTKVGDGLWGFFAVQPSAWFQILPPVVEAHGYDVSAVPALPWGAIVWAGTYAEFALPALIVAGLFTRLAALGMIVFVAVQTWVDVAFHGADATAIGAWFDRDPASAIMDQRLLWAAPLVHLAVHGAGRVSLDALLARWAAGRAAAGAAGPAVRA